MKAAPFLSCPADPHSLNLGGRAERYRMSYRWRYAFGYGAANGGAKKWTYCTRPSSQVFVTEGQEYNQMDDFRNPHWGNRISKNPTNENECEDAAYCKNKANSIFVDGHAAARNFQWAFHWMRARSDGTFNGDHNLATDYDYDY